MNKLLITILTVNSIFLFLIGCTNQSKKSDGVVDINDTRETEVPEPNLSTHKPFDVEVYKTFLMGESSYTVIYYQKENDTLKWHEAGYGAEEDYEKAAYKWLNDTMVFIRLFNPNSKTEVTFKVFGKGATSGMITND